MTFPLLAPLGISISALKTNPVAVITDAGNLPVAIFENNKPTAYLLSPKAWEDILERLDDAELAAIVYRRQGQKSVGVPVDKL